MFSIRRCLHWYIVATKVWFEVARTQSQIQVPITPTLQIVRKTRQAVSWSSLASQPSERGKLQVHWETMSQKIKGRWLPSITSGPHTHIYTYIYVQIQIHVHQDTHITLPHQNKKEKRDKNMKRLCLMRSNREIHVNQILTLINVQNSKSQNNFPTREEYTSKQAYVRNWTILDVQMCEGMSETVEGFIYSLCRARKLLSKFAGLLWMLIEDA